MTAAHLLDLPRGVEPIVADAIMALADNLVSPWGSAEFDAACARGRELAARMTRPQLVRASGIAHSLFGMNLRQ
jgi:hypothetical protein